MKNLRVYCLFSSVQNNSTSKVSKITTNKNSFFTFMDKIFNLLIFLLNPPMVLTEKEINNTLCKFQMKNYKKKKKKN